MTKAIDKDIMTCLSSINSSTESSSLELLRLKLRLVSRFHCLSIHQRMDVCVAHKGVEPVRARTQDGRRMEAKEHRDLVAGQGARGSEPDVSSGRGNERPFLCPQPDVGEIVVQAVRPHLPVLLAQPQVLPSFASDGIPVDDQAASDCLEQAFALAGQDAFF